MYRIWPCGASLHFCFKPCRFLRSKANLRPTAPRPPGIDKFQPKGHEGNALMQKRSLAPLLVCAVTLLICRSTFTAPDHFDAVKQSLTAISVPEEVIDTTRFDTEFCVGDNSGYRAGNRWAGDHHIGDVFDCADHSDRFLEDCRTCIEISSYSPFRD